MLDTQMKILETYLYIHLLYKTVYSIISVTPPPFIWYNMKSSVQNVYQMKLCKNRSNIFYVQIPKSSYKYPDDNN